MKKQAFKKAEPIHTVKKKVTQAQHPKKPVEKEETKKEPPAPKQDIKTPLPNEVPPAQPVKGYEIHPDVLKENEEKVAQEAPQNFSVDQLAILKQRFPSMIAEDFVGTRDEILSRIENKTGQQRAQVEVLLTGIK